MSTRAAYRRSLDELWVRMAELARLDAVAIEHASIALHDADISMAESVIAGPPSVAAAAAALEEDAALIIARQQPVATELRLVTGTITITSALARMGGLAQHVAQTARMRAPQPAVASELNAVFEAMSRTAITTATALTAVLDNRDAEGALALQAADSVMDDLHRDLFTELLARSWAHGIEPAIDAALLGRFYERFADQAATVARRVQHILTGA
jgi:phosphate transport system protein